MSFRGLLCVALVLVGTSGPGRAQQPAAADKPGAVAPPPTSAAVDPAQSMQQLDQLIAAPVKEARRTLSQAQQRYQAGLPPGEAFYLTTRIIDADGRFEQVYVLVQQWEGSYVRGTIASPPAVVTTFRSGQEIEFTTAAVLDWTLVHANGAEEGNYVGKFLDLQSRLDALER